MNYDAESQVDQTLKSIRIYIQEMQVTKSQLHFNIPVSCL